MVKADKTNYKKRFMNGFELLLNETHQNPYSLWEDLITVFAIEIQNTCTRPLKNVSKQFDKIWSSREQEYIKIMKKYNPKQHKIMAQMFTLLVLEYDKINKFGKHCDLLGEIYMELEIANKNAGQFFTPYSVCELTAESVVTKKDIKKSVKEKGYISINDSACGAGATIIAAVNKAKSEFKNLNYQNHVICFAQDIDKICALMCYIQLSLLPIAGIISVGNTLIEPIVNDESRIWKTPIYFSEVWQTRELLNKLKNLK